MQSKPVALLLAGRGVAKSHSRPHVRNDNPYSECRFMTMKHRPESPEPSGSAVRDDGSRHFEARGLSGSRVSLYRTESRRSALASLTPGLADCGPTAEVLAKRQLELDVAYQAHPERLSTDN
jgi:putative transposase